MRFPTAIVDGTTGTASNILGVIAGTLYSTDASAIKNAIASINAKLEALMGVLSSDGTGIGVIS